MYCTILKSSKGIVQFLKKSFLLTQSETNSQMFFMLLFAAYRYIL